MKDRKAFTLIEVMIVIAIIGVLAAIAQPAYTRYRLHALSRSCYRNQKTISGALQNYNLDTNQSKTNLPEVLTTLRDQGYLQTLPLDPAAGAGSHINYISTSGAFGVKCKVHGIMPQ